MKLSYNWLKQYIDMDVDPHELSAILTDIGLEVEGLDKFQSIKGGLEGVVVGEVLTCIPHDNADKLSVTTVSIGDSVLPIVCGAPNVAKGQKVMVATVGTTLYDGDEEFKIKKAKIRGKVSEGMICAEDELGLGASHDGIMVLEESAPVGKPAKEYVNIEEDWVYEIGLTPNRADAASHIGSARDLVAGLNWLKSGNYQLNIPSVDDFKIENRDLDIEVIVEDTEACPRYTGVTISGIKVEDSPEWLKNRLNAIGVRPINNIVDITNYVLHETGHPLHAFDAAKITGNKVVIKKLPSETSFVTLDEMDRKLHADDLMICNVEGGMCIAGVFGGAESGVTESTTNIFLESAYFDPTHIRKTSKRHVLQTDASFRFERGADPNITVYALKRAAQLIKDIAGGQVSSEIKDVYPKSIEKWIVDINFDRVTRLIGKEIEKDIIVKILQDLDIEVLATSKEGLKLLVPTFKVDVKREVDVVEEILRVYGYNNIEIPEKVNSSVSLRQKPDLERIQNLVADYLVGQGFVEIMNNSLTKLEYISKSKIYHQDNSVELLNPLSKDLDILRQTLLFGGLEVINYNQNRRTNDLKIFEFGKIYKRKSAESKGEGVNNYFEEKHLAFFTTGRMNTENWSASNAKADFYVVKGFAESILQRLGVERKKLTMVESSSDDYAFCLDYTINDKVFISVAEVSKKLLKEFGIKQAVYLADVNWDKLIGLIPQHDLTYKAISKFPAVRRDLALVVDKTITFEVLKNIALKAERKVLKEVGIFDIYEGDKIPEGKKSYALSFVLQDENKTLTDKIIDKAMKRIQQALEKEVGTQLR